MNGKNLTNFLIGAAVGGAAGVLLAPDKGSKTRQKLKSDLDKTAKKANSKIQDVKTGVAEQKDKLMEKKDEAMEKVEKFTDKIQNAKNKIDRKRGKNDNDVATAAMTAPR